MAYKLKCPICGNKNFHTDFCWNGADMPIPFWCGYCGPVELDICAYNILRKGEYDRPLRKYKDDKIRKVRFTSKDLIEYHHSNFPKKD